MPFDYSQNPQWKFVDYIEFLLFFTKMDNAQFDPNMAMEDMSWALQLLQYENNNIRQAFEHLKVGASLALQNPKGAINQQVF